MTFYGNNEDLEVDFRMKDPESRQWLPTASPQKLLIVQDALLQ